MRMTILCHSVKMVSCHWSLFNEVRMASLFIFLMHSRWGMVGVPYTRRFSILLLLEEIVALKENTDFLY